MIVKLLTEHHLEFLSLKGDCRGSSESTHVKMQHCWNSHALALNLMVKLLKLNVRINMVASSGSFCCSCHEENPLLHMPISEIEHVRYMIVASISFPASYGDI